MERIKSRDKVDENRFNVLVKLINKKFELNEANTHDDETALPG